MAKFRLADSELTDVYYFNEEEEEKDWVRVRASITNAESQQLLRHVPTGDRDLEGGFAFMERVFDKTIVAWSLEGVQPTVENFRLLDAASARQIEAKLGEHLGKLLGREVEVVEGESTS